MTPPTSLRRALRVWRDQDPMAPALRGSAGPWLCRDDLVRRLDAGHRCLHQAGLGPSDRVALLMPQGLDGAIATLQIAAACTLAPLRPGLPPHRWAELLAGLAPKAAVVSPETEPAITVALSELGIRRIPPEHLLEAPTTPFTTRTAATTTPEEEDRAEAALMITTSGTTGRPKWVRLNPSSVLRGCQAMARSLALCPADRTLLALPLHHVHGLVSCLWMPLITGGSVVVTEGFDADTTLRLLGDEAITWLSLPPAMHLALLDAQARAPLPPDHRLRFLRSGAVSLPVQQIAELQAAFGVPLIEAYGMSECPHISGNPLGSPRPGSVGKPVVEELRIVDADGQPLPSGRWGQVMVRGAPVMEGYLPTEAGQDAPFVGGWLATGDEGRLDGDGYLHLRGRLSERINRGGQKVMPTVVDAALLRHGDVREAMTFAVPHPTLGEDVAAAVVLRDGAGFDPQALRRHAFLHLAPHEVPSTIVRVEALPRGSTGKPQRIGMAERLGPLLQTEGDPATDGLEVLVAETFATVLRRPRPGCQANFFALGGDSLCGMRALHALENQLGLELQPTLLFHSPTVRSLAAQLRRRMAEAVPRPGTPPPGGSGSTPIAIPAATPMLGAWPAGCQAFPASFSQIRLWFLQQLQPELTAYHLPALWRLHGALDCSALEQALTALIARHPSLRTSFHLQGSELLQIIHPSAPVLLDIEACSDRDPDAVIDQWLDQERCTPFDFGAGLLLRARLLAVDHRHHLLLINHHHIASDGWSRSVLARDLTALYNAIRSGRPPELRPLSVAYQDYAAWQRQRLTGSRLQELKDHWIPQLTDLEPLELPGDHPRPTTPTHGGDCISFQIGPELLTPFEHLCRLEEATLQMGLLALVALLLHRTSHQDDFAIGVPIWGRNHADLETLIGCFINTLPIRTRFASQQSFRDLLQQVRTTSLAAYDHQELPFEQMLEALNLPRDTSRNPLVQVMLQLIELPEASLQGLEGLESELLISRPSAARFDLEIFLSRQQHGGLRGDMVYATDLFDAERLERMSAHLLTLLASVLEAPDAVADSLSLLPDSEQKLIESWQQGPVVERPDLCVHQLFEQQVQRTPESIALRFEDQQLTYKQLNIRANQLAHHLIDLGVGPDHLVGICLERSLDMVVALLAILKSGGAYLPLDPSYPKERLAFILEDSAPMALLVHGATRHQLSALAGGIPIVDLEADSRDWQTLAVSNPDPAALHLGPHHLAYVIYTSGSTGKPKGVMNEHRGIVNRLLWIQADYGLGCDDAVLQKTPIGFDVSVWEMFWPLLSGARLVLARRDGHADPIYLAEVIDRERITTLHFVPPMLQLFLQGQHRDGCPHLRRVICSGEALPASLVEQFHRLLPGTELHNLYGPTEAAVEVTAWDCSQPIPSSGLIPIGRPIANTRIYILDSHGAAAPVGVKGELCIAGKQVARGYLKRPELTAERFVPDPFSQESDARMYRTGDLARWLPDGNVEFLGRLDFQLKIRGLRIEAGEIETALRRCDGVRDALVLAHKTDVGDSYLVAYLTGTADGTEAIRRQLAETLPEHMLPAAFVVLDRFPLTPNGKLDRKALPAPSFSGNLSQRVEPSTDLQRQLHGLWAELLGHSDFGINDNFFLVGGHSLAAARLAAALSRSRAQSLTVATIFRLPTIGEQADALSRQEPQAPHPNLVTLQPAGDRPPLHVIHGWGGTVGGFIALARALAPRRPVLALQAHAEGDASGTLPRLTVPAMAARYADQILERHPGGPIHLLGYSAGGWYAHAVAAALLERGATIGVLAVLDTHPSARIHRRLGLGLLARGLWRWLPRRPGPHLGQRPGGGEGRRRSARDRLASLNRQLYDHLHLRLPGPERLLAGLRGRPLPPPAVDPYIERLRTTYRPPRLPLVIDLFAPAASMDTLRPLWAFYGRGGVRPHPLFTEHVDFLRPERVAELTRVLDETLALVEGSPAAKGRSDDQALG